MSALPEPVVSRSTGIRVLRLPEGSPHGIIKVIGRSCYSADFPGALCRYRAQADGVQTVRAGNGRFERLRVEISRNDRSTMAPILFAALDCISDRFSRPSPPQVRRGDRSD